MSVGKEIYVGKGVEELEQQFLLTFTNEQASSLARAIYDAYTALLKTSDFNELKEIVREIGEEQKELTKSVKELTEGQKHSEGRIGGLETAMSGLAKSQQEMSESIKLLTANQGEMRDDIKALNENQIKADESMQLLRESQIRTEEAIKLLIESQVEMKTDITSLTNGQKSTRRRLQGINESIGYALENEAYRLLPGYLERVHNITVKNTILRRYVGGQEVNIFGHGEKDGKPIVLVGEAKTRLGTDDFQQLWSHVNLVKKAQQENEIAEGDIIPIFITHMARQQAERRAQREDVIIVHSYEW